MWKHIAIFLSTTKACWAMLIWKRRECLFMVYTGYCLTALVLAAAGISLRGGWARPSSEAHRPTGLLLGAIPTCSLLLPPSAKQGWGLSYLHAGYEIYFFTHSKNHQPFCQPHCRVQPGWLSAKAEQKILPPTI